MSANKPQSSKSRSLALLACITTLLCGTASAQTPGFQFWNAGMPGEFGDNLGDNAIEDSEGGAPLGLGIFSRKPFRFTFSVREGFDSNVYTTRYNPTRSWYTNFGAGISYEFGSPRLQLRTNLAGGLTYYYNRPGDPIDWNGAWTLGATYQATPRLTLSVDTTTAYLSQPNVSILGTSSRQDGDYFYSNTSLSAAYQWTDKFSTVLAYRFGVIYYTEDEINDNQGRIEQTISLSGRYLVLPKTTGVLEYRVNPVTYFQADMDSLGHFFLIGVDQVFNPRLTWNARVGAELRNVDNPVDGESIYLGPYLESNLAYQFGPASSLGWLMRYGTEASGVYNVSQRQTFRTGLNLTHGFTRRLSGQLSADWLINYYDQQNVISSYTENVVTFAMSLNFAVNRFTSLSAGYQYTIDVAPDAPEREYNRNVAYMGANFSF